MLLSIVNHLRHRLPRKASGVSNGAIIVVVTLSYELAKTFSFKLKIITNVYF